LSDGLLNNFHRLLLIVYGDTQVSTTSRTLVDCLCGRAVRTPNEVAFLFLDDGETETCALTYGDLDRKARALSARLSSQCSVGDRALLLYSPGPHFVTAFLGCLYAGIVAVPTYFLDPESPERFVAQLIPTIHDAKPTVVIGNRRALDRIRTNIKAQSELENLGWIANDAVENACAAEWSRPAIDSSTLAILHYTSGSTGTPKGVMVSHANLLWRTHQEKQTLSRRSTHLTWRPIAHSGGLNHGVIRPLIAGLRSIIMPPEAFLQKPARWLQAISKYRVATSSAPNFAYDLCCRRVTAAERKCIDLSSWTTAFVVAEQVNPIVLETFANEFKHCGFRREAFAARYGLTESTGLVSHSPYGRGIKVMSVERCGLQHQKVVISKSGGASVASIVSAGRILNERVVIVDPTSLTKCPKYEIGEIWVSSKHAARGYWNETVETAATFKAFLANTREGPFLRTGDLGFVYGRDLFITGRLKELININGRKIYPQDVESTVANCHKSLGAGYTASFGIRPETGSERLIVVQEGRDLPLDDLDDVIHAIQGAVFTDQGVMPYAVLVVEPGSISRTANDKIRRGACRDDYLRKRLKVIKASVVQVHSDYWQKRCIGPQTATQNKLVDIWRSVLGRPEVGIYETFLDLGGSLDVARECRSRVHQQFGVELSIEVFLSDVANVRELANIIDGAKRKG
jgi:acyl-CoA synthetase (AMP-forming)/AMP-acid ligase II